ncbi:hypothetical protein V8C44DRAFT_337146 [Trichoderma aethiopicum]
MCIFSPCYILFLIYLFFSFFFFLSFFFFSLFSFFGFALFIPYKRAWYILQIVQFHGASVGSTLGRFLTISVSHHIWMRMQRNKFIYLINAEKLILSVLR